MHATQTTAGQDHGERHDHHESPEHSQHAGHGAHAGHHVEQFRRRFWWSLLLTIPIVAISRMVMDWFGYDIDFYGIGWVGPVLGSVVFV